MKKLFRPRRPLVPVLLALSTWSCAAMAAHDQAGDADLRLTLAEVASSQGNATAPLWLAANGSGMSSAGGGQAGTATDQWQEPWFTANKAHEYMGLGSLILAGLTVVTAPGDGDEGGAGGGTNDSTHQALANGALALGVGAVTTGLIYHWDDIHMDNGITDPDNLHALLGLVGTAGYAIAIANGGKGGHSAAGIVGAVSMIGAIKLEW